MIRLVQALRKQSKPNLLKERESSAVDISPVENIVAEHDYFEEQVERLFEQAVTTGQAVSAIDYWQQELDNWIQAGQEIEPKPWIELVFSCYCRLTNEQQDALDIKMQSEPVTEISDNYSYSDVQIVLKELA